MPYHFLTEEPTATSLFHGNSSPSYCPPLYSAETKSWQR